MPEVHAGVTVEDPVEYRLSGIVQVQVFEGGSWQTVASTVVRRAGRYQAAVARGGTYRAVFSGDAGPAVRVP